ncbi:hypothetical protein CHLRE_08g373346v5 [Chlamydomonas reinhardtii]|uniref:Glycosyl transferase CAP10 domain-containing protein n=1 Tax=Chlamydomonas reinhardtii TaxID=3055 RepID=A0A2K3DHE7_CHLRE|nr:uncharacterized protein CHLRE_08g373346v5 [Chlamydomonas reinhardtii]PNW79951.1 hypothetical protein CHLRE_08g373346v5 [Chlamydomonas reinhardtii]
MHGFILIICVVAACLQACDTLNVALVNIPGFHLEVVSGYIHVLAPLFTPLTVYVHPANLERPTAGYGFRDWIGHNRSDILLRALPDNGSYSEHDAVVFVSPEYDIPTMLAFVNRSNPRTIVLTCHGGCSTFVKGTAVSTLETAKRSVHFVALAPHAAVHASQVLKRRVHWVLPILPLNPHRVCSWEADMFPPLMSRSIVQEPCLSGFAIQGQLRLERRDYMMLWRDIEANWDVVSKHPRFNVTILGSGRLSDLNITANAAKVVSHQSLPYLEFYSALHQSLALLTLFSGDTYYSVKLSSSFISSFSAGTPLLIDQRVHEVYQFLHGDGFVPPHYAIYKGESMTQSMLRVLSEGWTYHRAVRASLLHRRERITEHTRNFLTNILLIDLARKGRVLQDQGLHGIWYDTSKGWCTSARCDPQMSSWVNL